MNAAFARRCVFALCLSLLQAHAALAAREAVEVHAYVNDACIIADEPFYLPGAGGKDTPDQARAKFLPLLGLVVGKLAELFINHEIQASAERLKSKSVRKDTSYTMTKEMNLYRADFEPAPAVVINAKVGCMTIVAASLEPAPTDCTAKYLPKELARDTMDLPQSEWKTTRTDDSIENQLRRANVCVAGKARAVYEARFEFSKDGTAYRMKDAGYRIVSLLTTDDKGASRSVLYTLKISQPGPTDQPEALSSAWVKLGTLRAGAGANGGVGEAAPWLRVPPMSIEARREYEDKSKVYQETMGEIEALKRAMIRNERMLVSLDARAAGAGADVAKGLREERTRIAIQNQTQGAELDARLAEYRDLPRTPLEFMPVTIEVAVTETESEKKMQLALADLVGRNSDTIASAAGNEASGLLAKSVEVIDLETGPDSADTASAFERARAGYFDALIDVKTSASGAAHEEAQRRLRAAKDRYNELRHSLGLEPVT